MKVTYNPVLDILRVFLNESSVIEESDEQKPGIIIDYDKDGNIIAFEILDASKRVSNPNLMQYEIAKSA
ncbi:MAG: hypothetical protein A3I68_09120 [Candidatus Melainabacteria bacterium RIFCSPLOWO2_02_FULL_35_15]|nr:MAG: hypothetical protein A3F80_03305 [Candidatus Melainabacteria bacterium RIFCSPLOWO2_12_FULL_35_11]OGI13680.1 MAG: hypothetical protein A3I68_09120 [Candidatus Melainabacteria bacterium RIFCSPLOWO2_02_FULL_35_15]